MYIFAVGGPHPQSKLVFPVPSLLFAAAVEKTVLAEIACRPDKTGKKCLGTASAIVFCPTPTPHCRSLPPSTDSIALSPVLRTSGPARLDTPTGGASINQDALSLRDSVCCQTCFEVCRLPNLNNVAIRKSISAAWAAQDCSRSLICFCVVIVVIFIASLASLLAS
jgi:hypothetical protein